MNFLMFLFLLSLNGVDPLPNTPSSKLSFIKDYCSIKYPDQDFNESFLFVEVKKQKMHLVNNGEILKSYPISTGKNGLGNIKDSNCTPKGLLKVHSKIGHKAPEGGILRGTHYIGRQANIYKDDTRSKQDYVTTRAIRLEGLEEGKNKGGMQDTFRRHIYIHGTPEEGLIGQPVSHGCIRMINADVIELYELITPNTKLLILNL